MVPEILSETDIFFFCHFGLFFALLPRPPSSLTAQNTEILKKSRKLLEIFYLSTMNKNQKSNDVWFLRYGAQQTEFFLILDHFLHFYTSLRNNPEMQNEKNTWRYHHFTQVYHKWQSYDIWFPRYEVHQTEFFCHLGPFFKKLQKKLYGPFLWMGFNCLKACATLRRQFTLYH